jgi:hypothetical protein
VKTILVSAALLSVFTASASAAPAGAMGFEAQFDPVPTGEGGNGAGSVRLASLVSSTFLFVPDSGQSLLVTVGEGGEGGEGGRGRRLRRYRSYNFDYYSSPRYRLHREYRPYHIPRRYERPYYDYDYRYYERPRPYFYF